MRFIKLIKCIRLLKLVSFVKLLNLVGQSIKTQDCLLSA